MQIWKRSPLSPESSVPRWQCFAYALLGMIVLPSAATVWSSSLLSSSTLTTTTAEESLDTSSLYTSYIPLAKSKAILRTTGIENRSAEVTAQKQAERQQAIDEYRKEIIAQLKEEKGIPIRTTLASSVSSPTAKELAEVNKPVLITTAGQSDGTSTVTQLEVTTSTETVVTPQEPAPVAVQVYEKPSISPPVAPSKAPTPRIVKQYIPEPQVLILRDIEIPISQDTHLKSWEYLNDDIANYQTALFLRKLGKLSFLAGILILFGLLSRGRIQWTPRKEVIALPQFISYPIGR